MAQQFFLYNPRLQIDIPHLEMKWLDYNESTQQYILEHWEKVRGMIPDKIIEFEGRINHKQDALAQEEDFEKSCQLNHEISELASRINDLWIWYRTTPEIKKKD
ncbi:hypothetical protein JOC86_001490 [Bacillus pakistanensis]|uniref:Uncharacterized protein n=2 Tax=Rossellomorea pakistanensis TaxID=992288 RepID=A0ABS2NAU2_9BACI|nr:hypothetical protein [Bacillus pakistanensis]